MIFYGPPGIGKTSFAAACPGVVFLIDGNERGVETLKRSKLLPTNLPVMPPITSWTDALEALDALRSGQHDYKAVAIDALGGFERLCHEEVCRRDYGGDWGKSGFASYQNGYDSSLADWRLFINALDALRDEKKMSVILLGHAKVSPFRNPSGPDYDRYNVDIHHKTWSLTHKWADLVLFANYEVAFAKGEENAKKGKAHGGKARVIYTEHEAAFDAKNRHGLPAELDMGTNYQDAWSTFVTAMENGRNNGANQ